MFDIRNCVNVVHENKELKAFTIPYEDSNVSVEFEKGAISDGEITMWRCTLLIYDLKFCNIFSTTSKCPLELVVRRGLEELSNQLDTTIQRLSITSMKLHEQTYGVI